MDTDTGTMPEETSLSNNKEAIVCKQDLEREKSMKLS